MSHTEILADFPYLTEEDIRACLAYAADAVGTCSSSDREAPL